MSYYVKKPCKNCPFRNDVKPYLHPRRAEELAYLTTNSYNSFTCHSTIEYDGDEDEYGRPTGDFSRQKTCAGFLTLVSNEDGFIPDGFEPSYDICYTDAFEMIQAYDEEFNN